MIILKRSIPRSCEFNEQTRGSQQVLFRTFRAVKKERRKCECFWKRKAGVSLSLTDHFSTPFDQEADLYALIVVPVNSYKGLTDGVKCKLQKWHEIILNWNVETNQVVIDGKLQIFVDHRFFSVKSVS